MHNILKKAERKKQKRNKRFKYSSEKERLPIFLDKATDIYNNYIENTIRTLEDETGDSNLELTEHIISNISIFNKAESIIQ
jgi:uncharacterized protein YdaT